MTKIAKCKIILIRSAIETTELSSQRQLYVSKE